MICGVLDFIQFYSDEPTVGVDPVLRQTIWAFLVDCAAGGTTVVITTHFMEEADKADRIGFMRGGRILVEGAPAKGPCL